MPQTTGKYLPFQLSEGTHWTGLTTENHIDTLFGRDPQYLSKVIRQLYDVNLGMSFVRWADQFGIEYIETNQAYKWKLKGRDRKKVDLQAAYEDAEGTTAIGTNNPRPGVNGTSIFMDFPERYFTVTNVIAGMKPDLWHLRVMEDPIPVGGNWRYRLQLMTNDDSLFIPVEELQAGTEWSELYSAAERYLGKEGSDIHFSSPFDMENRVSTLRKTHMVAGEMIDMGKNKPMRFAWIDEEGNTQTAWLSKLEWEFLKQFKAEMAYLWYYGKSTVREDGTSTMKGGSGNVIDQGYGIRDQFLPTNKHYYNTLTLDFLTQVALDVSVGKVARENREFVIGTGEFGLRRLHKMLAAELQANDYVWLRDHTGRGFSWKGNDIDVKFGQFAGAATIQGINFKFVHFPHYDDTVVNKLMHPDGGVAESHRMTILDFGSKSEPNIKKIRIKGRDPIYGYQPGLRDPFNKGGLGGKPKIMTMQDDGYIITAFDQEGGVVHDPTRVIEFIPSILR